MRDGFGPDEVTFFVQCGRVIASSSSSRIGGALAKRARRGARRGNARMSSCATSVDTH